MQKAKSKKLINQQKSQYKSIDINKGNKNIFNVRIQMV